MKDWLASPYRAVGIYIGGVNRACAQASLTPGWIRAVQAQGWHYFPLYVGLQAPCGNGFRASTISPSSAAAQGKAAADDAVAQAGDLGIPASTPIIYDMEAYGSGCSSAVDHVPVRLGRASCTSRATPRASTSRSPTSATWSAPRAR